MTKNLLILFVGLLCLPLGVCLGQSQPAVRGIVVDDPAPPHRHALVIGNANYASSGLSAPPYDAVHMQALLKQMNFSGTVGGAA